SKALLLSSFSGTPWIASREVWSSDTLIKPMVFLLAPEVVRAKMHGTFHISMIGLFTVLLIFVLAQIFRRGSEMRAELAGTI
ncbi:MAG: hypothetical protein WBD71_05680, partial [Xanthobacteraceae bacterium]